MKYRNLFFETYLNFEDELLKLTNFIYINDVQLNTFSSLIGELIIRIYVEIEALSKEIRKELDFPNDKNKANKQRSFDVDCLAAMNKHYNNFYNKTIYIKNSYFEIENKELKPFEEIDRSVLRIGYDTIQPKSNRAKKAYELIKHNKYINLDKGNIENLINALGTLYLLNVYYKFIISKIFSISYKELNSFDFSFGSKIFTIKKPDDSNLSNAIKGYPVNDVLTATESPLILKFSNRSYTSLLNLHVQNPNFIIEKYLNGKDISERAYLEKKVNNFFKTTKINYNYFGLFGELEKYSYSLKFKNMNYDEKKKILFFSEEFNANKDDLPFTIKEINKSNIDDRINEIGVFNGYRILLQFEFNHDVILSPFLTCELILDENNIKYKIKP